MLYWQACTTKPLQMIQNAAERVVFTETKRAHVTALFVRLYIEACPWPLNHHWVRFSIFIFTLGCVYCVRLHETSCSVLMYCCFYVVLIASIVTLFWESGFLNVFYKVWKSCQRLGGDNVDVGRLVSFLFLINAFRLQNTLKLCSFVNIIILDKTCKYLKLLLNTFINPKVYGKM